MKCEICGMGPEKGVTVYRQNDLGEVGRWRCVDHNQVIVDPETQRLVNVLKHREDKSDG